MIGVPALPGHALFLLFLQMSLILAVSRVLAELAKRLGQPAVIGELLAGIVLGPSLFGAVWAGGFHAVFPAEATQVHLLEVVAWIGMVLLLLLTGLETDVRLLRSLGRTAATSSALGMAVPFLCGFILGELVPSSYLADPNRRHLFACFLATAMSISAMPVIAKILMDLDLTKRNIGVVILSAGVVDDTTGWLILSIIAGIAGATGNVFLGFLRTVALTGVFLVACRYLIFPFSSWLFRVVDDRARTPHTDSAIVVILAFVLSAITEKIGIHAVFGAFIAGCILKQVPRLRPQAIHRLEGMSIAIFAPIFFGSVGLKVDLHTVSSPKMLLVMLAVATFGKLIGCTAGGLLGRMTFWESMSVGVAMNARGAMELVVALIGLNLGILNPTMFAIIVVIAISTSFMAPLGLRLTLRGVKMTAEEKARIEAENTRGLFDKTRLKTLIPTAGGPNALVASRIACALTHGGTSTLTLLFVESPRTVFQFIRSLFKKDLTGRNLQQHFENIKTYAEEHQARLDVRKATEPDPVETICREATHGFDLILLGAGQRNPLRSAVTTGILEHAPCHVGIVAGHGPSPGTSGDARRILVATNGSYFSSAAVELAVIYAEAVGGSVTVLYTMEDAGQDDDDDDDSTIDEGFRRMMATTLLTTLSPHLTRTTAKVSVIVRESDAANYPVIAEVRTGLYEILFVGAENRAVQHRLKVGYDVEHIVEQSPCTVMVVVPKVMKEAA